MDKRYLIVLGAVLVQGVTIGCVFAYGVFFSVLESEFGWSRTILSVATSIAFLNMGIFAIAAGRLSDRFGPRGVLTFTGLSTGLAYVLMYFLSAPWQLIVIYGLLVGLGLATHDVVTLSTVARWFPRRRGTMSGIVKVGTACGQMSIPIIAVALIASIGWRGAFVTLGIGATVILVLAAYLMGMRPSQPAANQAESSPQDGLTFKQAKQSRSFFILGGIQFFYFGSLITIPTHIVPHSIDSGLSTAGAATVLSTIAASSIAGRLLVGALIDRIGGKRCFNICLLLLFVSLASLLVIKNPVHLYAFGVLYGFTHGGLFTMVSPTVAEYFGMRSHGVIFGAIVFTGTIFGSMMPIVTGIIFDRWQSYDAAFVLLASMVFVSLMFSLCLASSAKAQSDLRVATQN